MPGPSTFSTHVLRVKSKWFVNLTTRSNCSPTFTRLDDTCTTARDNYLATRCNATFGNPVKIHFPIRCYHFCSETLVAMAMYGGIAAIDDVPLVVMTSSRRLVTARRVLVSSKLRTHISITAWCRHRPIAEDRPIGRRWFNPTYRRFET